MAWRLSEKMQKRMLGGMPTVQNSATLTDIAFVDGAGGNDSITASTGLAGFLVGQWVLIVGGTNDGIIVKVLTSAANVLEIPTGSISVASAATVCLVNLEEGGSLRDILKNGTIHIYTGSRPSTAELVESGTLLLKITLDGNTLTPGAATNGINLGQWDGTTIKRAVDPLTTLTEVWKGAGLSDDSAGWARFYDNNVETGAASSGDKLRMDGAVNTTGADLNMQNGIGVVTGVDSEVTDVQFAMTGV